MTTTAKELQWIYARRMKDASNEAFGQWLESLGPWTWFVTRTIGRPVDMGFTRPGVGTARAMLRDLLVRTEAKRFACVFEMQEDRGVPHLHALIGGCRAINGAREQERDFSKFGIARWKVFKRDAGAPAYLGKYLTKSVVEFYIGHDGPYTDGDLKGPTVGGTRL